MRIGTPGQRVSDQIMRGFVARQLGIPETDAEQDALTKTAAVTDQPKTSTDHNAASCPECGANMLRKGNMERCACGYAQASPTARVANETAAQPRRASETSVAEYYKKIFPDDYVSELTGEPDAGQGGEKVEYGHVNLNKPTGDVGVKAHRVSVRRFVAEGAEDSAGECEVPDKDPTPPEAKPNGKAKETGDCKEMGGDSANSVGGPSDIPAGEKPNGKANEAGEVKTPDLGVPKGAHRRTAGGMCQKCGTALDQAGACPTCNSGAEQNQAQASRMLTREQVAAFCPECAVEMKRLGVKAISARWIASKIAERARAQRTA